VTVYFLIGFTLFWYLFYYDPGELDGISIGLKVCIILTVAVFCLLAWPLCLIALAMDD